jgi:5-methyltetrahydrofolate--homocysteine methyltransferase
LEGLLLKGLEAILSEIKWNMAKLEKENVIKLVKKALKEGVNPYKVLDSLREGMEEIGRYYEQGEYFISELVYAGELMKSAMEILQPHLKVEKTAFSENSVVLGTALGDIHDIGKEIVKTLLVSAGFNVYDLGVDVPPEAFVNKAKEVGAKVIGISALLSTTTHIASDVVKLLSEIGLKNKIKVILGGAAVRSWMIKEFGVDAAVNDAMEGIKIIKQWIKEA